VSSSHHPTPSPSAAEQEANVETVRQAIEAFNRRDVEAMIVLGGDDFVYDWSRSIGPTSGIYHGPEAFIDFVQDQWSMFDEVRLEVHEYITRGPYVVATTTTHGRGRDGISVTANSASLYTFENGRLTRITLYQNREEALIAAAHV
jgi:ketosteroid isomerase-like protein